jgi:hypothetical protein
MTKEQPKCAECGDADGIVQHVDIAWPGGRHWEGWLHPECETVHIARLEQERKRV